MAAGDAVNAPASVVRSTLAAVVLAAVFPAIAAADMLDASLTPGAVEDTDATIVCAYGYASTHRTPSETPSIANTRSRGGTRSASPRRGYRIDHLVPLELGGANDARNLWPQRFSDSKVQDRVEERTA